VAFEMASDAAQALGLANVVGEQVHE
jgi:hypothetical protein